MARPKDVAILMNLSRPFDRQVIQGITKYIQTNASWHLYVEENPADKIPSLTTWSGDGLIADMDDARNANAIGQFDCKIVGIGSVSPEVLRRLNISSVSSDDRFIGEWVANHLLERHLEHFGYCGIRTLGLDRWVRIRRDAFRQRICEVGHECSVFTGPRHAPRNWDLMQQELMQWLTGLPKPVGVMACNDLRGRHVLEACRRSNLRVPDDVAVIGVDNDNLMCELAIPPLSSVNQGCEQIGFLAAELLDKLMRGQKRRPDNIIVPPTDLVTRQSSDLVAVKDPIMAQALKFIRNHGTERIGVSNVVEHVGVSRSTLENRFKFTIGRTVHTELQKVKIDTARRLLTSTDLPLHIVANKSGFSSPHYMSAVFQRELGYPPGQLRSRATTNR